ncbi:hypothetical protein GCK72_017460 [Caenorhabditis remanei]|uniref:Serpentine Receptor, class H n=1 Tax=Caenorhabditis remanei TaxID=31234 RepID=A0A6A5G8Q5_CAERE|nr:hypothetical protein GCK72_017460 [Caenorhabditis remanei]KAF1750909.1 hypothetical protein GCK72_017460 [Caenorhabditis remanei]
MDCAESEHASYYWIMHSVFIISLPVYALAILALLQTKSPYFEKYKLFLIWHTSTNLLAELLNSWFLLPVVHLPLPLLRFTGYLSLWGFSGLLQFLIIGSMIYLTAYSVFEMFMFRFRVSLLNYRATSFYLYLRVNTYIFRGVLLMFIIANCVTYTFGLELQAKNRQKLFSDHQPDASILVLCPTVIVAVPLEDPVAMYNMVVWVLVVFITITSTSATTVYLKRNLKENAQQSAAVVRMHKMLLITLAVQTAIHGFMLGAPNAMFIFAGFFGVRHEFVAKLSFISLTVHGFASTLAMILLTKPIKNSVILMLKCKMLDKLVVEDTRRMSHKF